ncbi:tricarballylate dehydrogenase [Amniculicola lignicola CBS 123094]|uniref:Tricarballylate dehydrogenase n=1 Tax=Amniculicola lignicola CBS 123094 TaxID=1392246 RepID=A0A6A5WS61_9PLEO|nr:tricarballylate dehydrogenase [Amniculicola lignicola CBS 123094]
MSPPPPETYDILIVGSGNAGLSAALSAYYSYSPSSPNRILIIDKCPPTWAGGNTFFTAGAYRTTHSGLSGPSPLLPFVNNVSPETAGLVDLDAYTIEQFEDDLMRVTDGRTDRALARVLVGDSYETVKWLREVVGVRFQLSFNRQAYKVDGRWRFWGGLHVKTEDGGRGLVEDELKAVGRCGIGVRFDTAVRRILKDDGTGSVSGVVVERDGEEVVIRARAVVLAAGGFEANPEMRKKYMGPNWDLAHVRGTPHNTGDLLSIAIRDVSAKVTGDWTSCHSVAWDANAPHDSGDREVSNEFTKSGYPLGLMINIGGRRFVDEGMDLRNYTYAKFGRAILEQDDGCAFQVWDNKTIGMLRDEEYREERVERITAGSIEELADKCVEVGLNEKRTFIETIKRYNEAVYAHRKEHPHAKFDPTIKDGLSTQSSRLTLDPPKSNWALSLDEPPFLAVKVACGITFTFGGLAVNPQTAAVVSSRTEKEIPGLFCVGEMMGGLFYGNYPWGSGLMSGAVFGRRAGKAAAEMVSRC